LADLEKARKNLALFYRVKPGFDLEKEPWFEGWIDSVDERGNAMFRATCELCGGTGLLPTLSGKSDESCHYCGGAKTVIGPVYCEGCKGLLPHIQGAACSNPDS